MNSITVSMDLQFDAAHTLAARTAQDESELNWPVPLTCSRLKPIFRS
ncbi:hypothetical protein [Streptomyces sp. AC555_RSS877]|nr:hypothetical protein [Streptomyces sp. AC555_RSS877]